MLGVRVGLLFCRLGIRMLTVSRRHVFDLGSGVQLLSRRFVQPSRRRVVVHAMLLGLLLWGGRDVLLVLLYMDRGMGDESQQQQQPGLFALVSFER